MALVDVGTAATRTLVLGVLALLWVAQGQAREPVDVLSDSYLSAWAAFYPTQALAQGNWAAAGQFEDYTGQQVADWLQFNEEFAGKLAQTPRPDSAASRVDLEILRRQVAAEVALWSEDDVLRGQPQWYAEQVSQALTYLLVRERLPQEERYRALLARLAGIRRLCDQGREYLVAGNRWHTEAALRSLAASERFFRDSLAGMAGDWGDTAALAQAAQATADSVAQLSGHLQTKVLPGADPSPSMGGDRYAARLSRRSHGQLTPDQLRKQALAEIDRVRAEMEAAAAYWWQEQRDGHGAGVDADSVLTAALEAMEAERDDNPQDFLHSFTALTAAAETFVREHELATVPQPTTLYIALSPAHFAGAAVGGVYPTGPFAPEADTLFYLPSVPAGADAATAAGFYRSFNHHFNTMIISHEMFPGHYLQYRVAVEHAPPIRSIFADGAYVEGWGSFSEELMLEAGWGGGDRLTWLAHLRKRLENATRSYLSVMVHARGWDQQQVTRFAVERGLLAPQFAVNLWQRLVTSPLQLTDYFVGYRAFKALWRERQAREGAGFDQRSLVDGVLRAGPVPVDALPDLLPRTSRD